MISYCLHKVPKIIVAFSVLLCIYGCAWESIRAFSLGQVVQRTSTLARVEAGRSLKSDSNSCESLLGLAQTESIRAIDDYLRCRSELRTSENTVLFVSEEIEIVRAFDSFRAVDLIVEIPGRLESGRHVLPSQTIRVFANNCRRSWTFQSGCVFGSTASGYIDINLTSPQGAQVEINASISPEDHIGRRNDVWQLMREHPMTISSRATIGSKEPTVVLRRI